jgi:N-methylhydantoinase A
VLTVGIDLGGTFTDGYFGRDERSVTRKVPTYRFDLSRSIVECLRAGAEAFDASPRSFLRSIDLLRISTTVGTNSLIEGTGSRVGLIVEAGQERLLYAGATPEALFDTFLDPALVRGLAPASDPDTVLEIARDLVAGGVRQVVVSLPGVTDARDAETSVRSLIKQRYPPHYLRSVPLQLGTDVAPCGGDEVRTATAVINAYLHRDVAQLLHGAEQELRNEGLESPVLVVHANAGVARIGKTTAINTYSSGPAAGLSAAQTLARAYGEQVVVTADMGGTTVDLGAIRDGDCEVEARPDLGGVRVALPMLRTESIGCAGCSIAAVSDGSIALGPESAGSVPGPAAFGLGGERPTLTDADVVCGLLAAGKEVGGRFALDADRAMDALREHVGTPLGVGAEEAAGMIQDRAAEQIGAALRDFMRRKGLDPEEAVVYAFGGAGPTHIWAAANHAGVRRVRSFSFGSAFSALGCTVVDLRHRYELPWDGEAPSASRLAELVDGLVGKGLADVRAERAQADGSETLFQIRLLGPDGETLATSALLPAGAGHGVAAAAGALDALPAGTRLRGIATEVVATIPQAELSAPESASGGLELAAERPVRWNGSMLSTPVRTWADLPVGVPVAGPVIVEELDCTHAVGPGWQITVDDRGTALWEAVA